VRTLAARAPLALTALKENLRDAEHLDLAAYLDVETVRMVGTVATDDAAEATDAFLAKRTPRFLGR
jgi:2-(1,2-epoxy-1,2-dihydrophenyl)acetyl-CoA isomerase